MTVGRSGITPIKQKNVQDILSSRIGKCSGIWKKDKDSAWYNQEDKQNTFIDFTAGDMSSDETSPMTFIQTLRKYSYFPSVLYLIEKDRKTFQSLLHNIRKLNVRTNYNVLSPMFKDDHDLCTVDAEHCKVPPEIILKNMDLCSFLGEFQGYHRYRFGLAYYDPNGFKYQDFKCLFSFIRNNPRMDIMMNINATQIKRNAGVMKCKGFAKYRNISLDKVIKSIAQYKKTVFIRNNFAIESDFNPKSTHKFILLYATNDPNQKMPDEFGFVTIQSEEGQQLINKYNYGSKENKHSGAVCQPV